MDLTEIGCEGVSPLSICKPETLIRWTCFVFAFVWQLVHQFVSYDDKCFACRQTPGPSLLGMWQ